MTAQSDSLVRFLLPDAGVRGVHVHLDDTWREILSHAVYPPGAAELLGEASVASALFTGHTKVDGRLSIQLRSNTAMRTLFAECTAAGTLRGIVQLAEGGGDAPRDLTALGEDALLAITIENPGLDPREPQRYQSLVGLTAAGLDEAFEDYFRQSEQLPTRLLLAADGTRAAGCCRSCPAMKATRTAGRGPAHCSRPWASRNCSRCPATICCTASSTKRRRNCWATRPCALRAPARVSGWQACCSPLAKRRPAPPPSPLARWKCVANSVGRSITSR